MTQACVSLDEVLVAAAARAASLVPETSGYLALAVADATSRLPYQHDDRAVLLTVDGSVMVPRKGAVAPPPEAGRGLRDLLRRLLASSTGSMPGLTSAARPRAEEIDVDRVVSDIEAALIPVNRAAAKRALARLARETLRAKELGKLRKKASRAPAAAASPPAGPAPATHTGSLSRNIAPAPQMPSAPPKKQEPRTIQTERAAATAQPEPAPRVEIAPPALVTAPIVHVTETPAPPAPRAELAPPVPMPAPAPTPTPTPFHVEVAFEAEEPSEAADAGDATLLDPEAMAVIEAAYRPSDDVSPLPAILTPLPTEIAAPEKPADTGDDALTRPWQPVVPVVDRAALVHTPTASASHAVLVSELGSTRADELLESFQPQDHGDPALAAAASSLRALAGVDLTQPPRTTAPRSHTPETPSYLRASAPAPSRTDDDLDVSPLPPPRAVPASTSRWPFALFAVGVLVLFAAWVYRPTLARDFFGLRKLLAPQPAPQIDAPPARPALAATAAPGAGEAPRAAPATPHRPRDARASSAGDGQHRRRD